MIHDEWVMDEAWLARFRSCLTGIDVVTFDVFDTALTRILDMPVDVFAIAEDALTRKYGIRFSGYAVLREEAEQKAREVARNASRSEVNFSEILSILIAGRPDYGGFVTDIMGAELEAEHATCFAVPEIAAAVRFCREQDIRVVFVSDMYLSADVIRDLLLSAGYDDAQDLLVSSETGYTKADGKQWGVVQEFCGADARILHVGDNEWGDVIMPMQAGIKAFAFPRVRSNVRDGGPLTPAVLPYSFMMRGAVLRGGAGSGGSSAGQIMSMLGASWGALVAGSVVSWLVRRAQELGLKRLYFCARDGWLLWQAWKELDLDRKTGISSVYLYVSRYAVNYGAVTISCRPDHLSDEALALLTYVSHPETVRSMLKRGDLQGLTPLVEDLMTVFGTPDAEVSDGSGAEEFRQCLQRHAGIVYAHLRQSMTNALYYFRQEGLHEGPCGIVDIGWQASVQASIADILREGGYSPMLYGLYAGLRPGAQAKRLRAGWLEGAFGNDYMQAEHLYGLFNAVAILENGFSSSDGVTLGYEWKDGTIKPVLADSLSEGSQHKELIAPFQQAALQAISLIFAGAHPSGLIRDDLTLETGQAAISRLSLSPTSRELAVLGSIRHSPDLAHVHVVTLVPELRPDAVVGSHLDLRRREWPVGSALAALRRCGDPEMQVLLAQDIRRQCAYYDSRSLSQFR
ncbi:HAD-IA family hydrolase [Acetobacter fallax]|uniref:HAD-IA family hydrolase n=1 Tax=Acetobacter fallax TaxID=1737473 RepID=UPI00156AD4FC